MAAKLEMNALCPEAIRCIERVVHFGERHIRSPSRRELRGGNPTARGADHHHPTATDQKPVRIHAITAASALSG
jgi:hypothetical protein